jgi:hypothetical protein
MAVGIGVEEQIVETGFEYVPGDAVRVRIVRRDRRTRVTDDGGAVERTGLSPGWREAAARIAGEIVVNISRHGVISLPVSPCGPALDALVQRIGEASLALYQEILELDR